jgi:hypothetical protein
MTIDATAQVFAEMLYASTTESRIPWRWLAESRKGLLLLTEWERVEMFLRAINGESLKVREWTRFCGAPLTVPGFTIKGDAAKWEDLPIPLFEIPRLRLKETLEAVIRSPDHAIPEIDRNAKTLTRSRVLTVSEEFAPGTPRDRVLAHDVASALIYALRLVLDKDKPFWKRLQQCEFSGCGRFVLAKPHGGKGRPRDYSCPGTDHGAQRKKELQNEWAAAHRDGKTVEEWRALKAAEAERKLRAQKARRKQHMRGTSK